MLLVLLSTLAAAALPLAAQQQTLSLHDAIRNGLAQAPAAHAEDDLLAAQHAAVIGAGLRPNPRLYLQSEDLHPWDHGFSFPDDTEDYGYLGETLELDGKRGKRVAYADDELRTAQAERALAAERMAAAIADAYWAAAAARAEAAQWRAELADFDRLVQYQSARVEAGAAAGVDLLRTQLERDRIAVEAARTERAVDASNIRLALRSATEGARTAPLSDALEQERPVGNVALETALAQRPDMEAAHAGVEAAGAELRLEHANGVPDLDLLAGYKRDVGVNTAYGSLQWDLPLFNRNQGGIAAARAHGQLAEDRLEEARVAAVAEIETALAAYQQEQELVRRTLPGMRDRAERNAGITEDVYRSGGTDLLRLLDAERVLIDTRLLSIQTWADYQMAVVSLQIAYGEQP